jgi:hypothetical protein
MPFEAQGKPALRVELIGQFGESALIVKAAASRRTPKRYEVGFGLETVVKMGLCGGCGLV